VGGRQPLWLFEELLGFLAFLLAFQLFGKLSLVRMEFRMVYDNKLTVGIIDVHVFNHKLLIYNVLLLLLLLSVFVFEFAVLVLIMVALRDVIIGLCLPRIYVLTQVLIERFDVFQIF